MRVLEPGYEGIRTGGTKSCYSTVSYTKTSAKFPVLICLLCRLLCRELYYSVPKSSILSTTLLHCPELVYYGVNRHPLPIWHMYEGMPGYERIPGYEGIPGHEGIPGYEGICFFIGTATATIMLS